MKQSIILIFIAIFLVGCNEQGKDTSNEKGISKNGVPVTADFRTDPEGFPVVDSIPKHVLATIDNLVHDSSRLSVAEISKLFDSKLLDNLTISQKANIYNELLKVDEDISQALYTRLLEPIDGMKGVRHKWGDELKTIDALLKNSNNVFNDKNKFFVYSQYGRIESEDIVIPASGVEPELRNKILNLLRNEHNTRYQELLNETDINNEQDLLDKYFLNKWTIVKALGYGDTLITSEIHRDISGNSVSTRFDVGAVCPPVCP